MMLCYFWSVVSSTYISFFFFNDTATTEIYTLSLHDALPILGDQLVLETAQDDYDEQSALVKQFSKEINEAKEEKGKLTKQATLIERKLINLDPVHMDFSNRIGNVIRDLPFIDFLSPYYKVEQIVVNDITDNVNFTRVPKVDRCMTCHKGILDQEFESDTQPFKAHPRLDLYLSSTSPHPVEEFGCTSCHGGRGRGRSEEHTSELQSQAYLVCRLLLDK